MFVLSLGITATTFSTNTRSMDPFSKTNNNSNRKTKNIIINRKTLNDKNAANITITSKNLLGMKVNVFKFLNDLLYRLPQEQQKSNKLFPSLKDASIVNLNNSKNQSKLPINCAADDLDLSLSGSNDQIEFFTNFISTTGNVYVDSNSVSTANSAVSSLSNNGILMAPQANQSSYQGQFNSNVGNIQNVKMPYYYNNTPNSIAMNPHHAKPNLPEFDDFLEAHQNQFNARNEQLLHHYQQSQQIHMNNNSNNNAQQFQSQIQHDDEFSDGYNFSNMIGLNTATNSAPYFNDFNHQVDVYLSSSVSSNESYISPLDDEFFKKFNNNNGSASTSTNNVTPFTNFDALIGDEDDDIEDFSRKRKFDSVSSQSSSNFEYSLSQEQFIPPTSVPNTRKPSLLASQSIQAQKQKHKQPKMPQSPKKYKKKKSNLNGVVNSADIKIEQSESNIVSIKQQPMDLSEQPIQEAKKSSRSNSLTNNNGDVLNHSCPHCSAAFKVKGYLTRHLKKHNSAKAFVCPFYQEPSDGTSGTKCHPTGGFSRRDTYKTHLKALHFIYPPGTKSNERNSISGRCAGCFQFFENNIQWLETHIETGSCTGTVECKLQGSHQQEKSPLASNQDQDQDEKVIKVKVENDFDTQELEVHASHYIKQEIVD
ncbi:zinc finger protein [Scheffersomyces amazonensis]|uniref:zinc finger protein n=1 Tax=Scheffersomyces amazonensis TaxID=1078765 RepID=UPI00315C9F57